MMEFGINDYMTDAERVKVETEKGYIKTYEKVKNEWKLVEVEAENGEVTELTSIPDYKTTYADLKSGRIWNELQNDFSNANKPNYYGYIYSSFEGKPVALHVLIMSAYTQIKPKNWRKNKLEIDHINGNKTDNRIDNLRLVTRKQQYENEEVRAKMGNGVPFNKEEIQYIRYFTAIVKAKGKQVDSKLIHLLADKFNKRYETVRRVINNVSYKNVELTKEMIHEIRKIELVYDLKQLELIA